MSQIQINFYSQGAIRHKTDPNPRVTSKCPVCIRVLLLARPRARSDGLSRLLFHPPRKYIGYTIPNWGTISFIFSHFVSFTDQHANRRGKKQHKTRTTTTKQRTATSLKKGLDFSAVYLPNIELGWGVVIWLMPSFSKYIIIL